MATINFAAPPVNKANVLYGVGVLYTAPGEPDVTPLPDDADLGAAPWADPWVFHGATDQGVKLTWNPKTQTINIEEDSLPVATLVDTVDYTIELSLAEETLTNIQMAFGGGGELNTTVAATGVAGKSVLTLSTDAPLLVAAVVGKNQQGKPRIVYIPGVQSVGQVETTYRRVADKRMYPATLNALCKPSDIQIIDITADPL